MKKFRKKLIKRTLGLDEKYLAIFTLLLSVLNEEDEIITKVGKITRLKENTFSLTVDEDVVSASIGGLLDDIRDTNAFIFNESKT